MELVLSKEQTVMCAIEKLLASISGQNQPSVKTVRKAVEEIEVTLKVTRTRTEEVDELGLDDLSIEELKERMEREQQRLRQRLENKT